MDTVHVRCDRGNVLVVIKMLTCDLGQAVAYVVPLVTGDVDGSAVTLDG